MEKKVASESLIIQTSKTLKENVNFIETYENFIVAKFQSEIFLILIKILEIIGIGSGSADA